MSRAAIITTEIEVVGRNQPKKSEWFQKQCRRDGYIWPGQAKARIRVLICYWLDLGYIAHMIQGIDIVAIREYWRMHVDIFLAKSGARI